MKNHIVFGRGAVLAILLGAATAAHGQVFISRAQTSNMNCAGNLCSGTAAQAVLNVKDLQKGIKKGDFTVDEGVANSIVVAAPVKWSKPTTLTLFASSIVIGNTINVNGTGNLAIETGTGTFGPALSFPGGSVTFLDTASVLTINGVTFQLENSLASLAAAMAANWEGNFALAGDYNAGADGTYKRPPILTVFNGTFEGLGNTITKLTIKGRQRDNCGLFNELSATGQVRDIRLTAAKVTGGKNGIAGGLVGDNQGVVVNASVSGNIGSGPEFDSGGLIGVDVGTVSQSQSSANVKGNQAGSLVGEIDGGTVMDSYATGTAFGATGANQPVSGGLVGETTPGTIKTSYSTGTASGNVFGGSVGFCFMTTATDVYWDTTTSLNTVGCGEGSASITGLTTAQLQSGLPAGFSPSVWAEQAGVNNGLPYLISLGPNP